MNKQSRVEWYRRAVIIRATVYPARDRARHPRRLSTFAPPPWLSPAPAAPRRGTRPPLAPPPRPPPRARARGRRRRGARPPPPPRAAPTTHRGRRRAPPPPQPHPPRLWARRGDPPASREDACIIQWAVCIPTLLFYFIFPEVWRAYRSAFFQKATVGDEG